MFNSNDKYRILHNIKYNAEPVVFCKHCLSLKIRDIDDTDYCDECGSTEVDSTDIFNWEELYKTRYNIEFLSKK